MDIKADKPQVLDEAAIARSLGNDHKFQCIVCNAAYDSRQDRYDHEVVHLAQASEAIQAQLKMERQERQFATQRGPVGHA